jgi:integrase
MQFLVYTTARSQEVLRARWPEIDLVAGVWNVPPEHMKARKPHRVPLAPEVIALLRDLYTEEAGDLVQATPPRFICQPPGPSVMM